MNVELQKLANELLALPNSSRLALGEYLVESVEGFVDEATQKSWEAEASRRMTEVENGTVAGIPSEEVFRDLIHKVKNKTSEIL